MSQIAGVLVHAHPRSIESVRGVLTAIPGVEVHAVSDEGRMVVTVEDEGEGRLADTFIQFQDIKGVLSAAVIYHHLDEADGDTGQDAIAGGHGEHDALAINILNNKVLDEQEAVS